MHLWYIGERRPIAGSGTLLLAKETKRQVLWLIWWRLMPRGFAIVTGSLSSARCKSCGVSPAPSWSNWLRPKSRSSDPALSGSGSPNLAPCGRFSLITWRWSGLRKKTQGRGHVLLSCHRIHTFEPLLDANQISTRLPIPTAYIREQLAQIELLLRRIWRDDVHYMKGGGVMLVDFSPKGTQQWGPFGKEQHDPRSDALMQVIDRINQGRLGKVYFASRG